MTKPKKTSLAQMTLTDNDGKLELHVEYRDADGKLAAPDPKSCPSHEHMLLMVMALDMMADPKGEPIHISSEGGGGVMRARPAHPIKQLLST